MLGAVIYSFMNVLGLLYLPFSFQSNFPRASVCWLHKPTFLKFNLTVKHNHRQSVIESDAEREERELCNVRVSRVTLLDARRRCKANPSRIQISQFVVCFGEEKTWNRFCVAFTCKNILLLKVLPKLSKSRWKVLSGKVVGIWTWNSHKIE